MVTALPNAAYLKFDHLRRRGWGQEDDPEHTAAHIAYNASTLLIEDIVAVIGYALNTPTWWRTDERVSFWPVVVARHAQRRQTIITAVNRDVLAQELGAEVAALVDNGRPIELDPTYDWSNHEGGGA